MAGFIGEKCENYCPEGTYGNKCENQCQCVNNGKCNPENGNCTCSPGYEGIHCENQCQVSSNTFMNFYVFKKKVN